MVLRAKPLSREYKCKLVQEMIVEFLDIRFGDNPNIRDVPLNDFSMWIGRQVIYELDDESKKKAHVKQELKHRKIKKYLSLSK